MEIINILKYIIGGVAIGLSFFLIIYYIIWFIINVIRQINEAE